MYDVPSNFQSRIHVRRLNSERLQNFILWLNEPTLAACGRRASGMRQSMTTASQTSVKLSFKGQAMTHTTKKWSIAD